MFPSISRSFVEFCCPFELIRFSSGFRGLKISTSTSVDVEIFRGDLNDKVDFRLIRVNDMRSVVYLLLAAIDVAVNLLCPSRLKCCV